MSNADDIRHIREDVDKAVERAIEKSNAPTWSDDVLGGAIEEQRVREQAASRERFARICENSENVTARASTEIELRERLEAAADRLATVSLSPEQAAQWNADFARVNVAIGRGDEKAAHRLDLLEAAVRFEREKMLPAWMRGRR
jgi:hypothetical protein